MSTDNQNIIIRKIFDSEKKQNRIRIGNTFFDEFLFENHQIADIPINALRVIFNIISTISSEQFRPEDRPQQLTLFDEEFETENNTFVAMKIRNNRISPSNSTKQVIAAYEFLVKFRMGWYKSVNAKGKEIKTFGGLISTPSYDQRGYTSFLINTYWLKKLIVIPEYNYVLYNLVYHIPNNKHILFAIWLTKIPQTGITLKLSTMNEKFGLNYKSSNDFCKLFLKPLRNNLNKYNNLSFHFKNQNGYIFISPIQNKAFIGFEIENKKETITNDTYRLNYLRKRFKISDEEKIQLSFQYTKVPSTKILIESAYKDFVKNCRLKKIKTSEFEGKEFLRQIQEIMIVQYRQTKAGQLLPNGYPLIL